MPIFDFKCGQCGHVSEILMSRTESQEIKCPECGSSMEKLISSSSFLMKAAGPASGRTCCGRAERCETPPCSTGGGCRRH
jgi:putative FmdB family regulatory protein